MTSVFRKTPVDVDELVATTVELEEVEELEVEDEMEEDEVLETDDGVEEAVLVDVTDDAGDEVEELVVVVLDEVKA
jgi:hypothetical protein